MTEKECRLGVDFHGVIAADAPLVWRRVRFNHGLPKDALKDVDLVGHPSPVLYPNLAQSILKDRRVMLADPEHLKYISPCAGIALGLPLAAKVAEGRFYMITAMEEVLRDDLNGLLKRWRLDSYLPDSNLYLRPDSRESPLVSKLRNAERAGITHMIEDDPVVVVALVKAGLKLIHIVNGTGRLGVPNSPNVIRFGSFFDFAMEAAKAGSVEGVFENRKDELQNSEDPYRIFEPDPVPCIDKDFECKIRGICFLTSEIGRFYIGPSDPYISYKFITL